MRIRLLLARRTAPSLRVGCLASFPAAGASLRLYSYDSRLETAPRRAPRRREAICARPIADPPLPRQRQAVDRDLRRHVPLPDDPRNRLLLGRRRPPLPEEAGVRRRRLRSFAARPTRSARSWSTTRCCGCRPRDPALAELVATGEAAVDVDQTMGRARAVPADAGPGEDTASTTARSTRTSATRSSPSSSGSRSCRPSGTGSQEAVARRDLRASVERGDPLERLRFLGLPARRLLFA